MRYKLILFDFDGTLADSIPWMVGLLDRISSEHALKKVEADEIEDLRLIDLGTLVKRYNVPLWKLALIGRQVKQWMARDIHDIHLFAGVDRLLQSLAAQGAQLGVVSSNALENVRQVLGPENAALIRYYECGVALLGKRAKLHKILIQSGVHPRDAILIGDEIRDVQAAHQAQIAAGAVAWGYARAEAFQPYAPFALFHTLDELGEYLTAPA